MSLFPGSFRNRLMLLFVSLSLTVWLPLYLYVEHVYTKQVMDARSKALNALAAAAATVVAENLRERQREIELLAKNPIYYQEGITEQGMVQLTNTLNRLKDSYAYYSWIGFADVRGIVQAASGGLLLGQNVSQRPWFQQGLQGRFIGDLHEAVLLSKLLPVVPRQGPVRFIDFAAPVFGANQELLGVVASHAHWDWSEAVINALASIRRSQPQVEIHILNSQQQVIYPAGDTPVFEHRALQQSAKQGRVIQALGSDAEYLVALHSVPNIIMDKPLNWSILIHQPLALVYQEVDHLRRILLFLGLVATLSLLILIWWSASLICRPLERVAHLAKRIEQGDEQNIPDIQNSTVEIRLLKDAITGMARTLIARRLKLLRANVSLEEKVALRTRELAEANGRLEKLAKQDALTGVFNRLAAQEQLNQQFAHFQQTQSAYSVLILDIDYFKRINDTYGHAIGDQALKRVTNSIKGRLRHSDSLFRMGGEEFMVLLPETSLQMALQVAEHIRVAVESQPDPVAGQITLSIGIAEVLPEDIDSERAVHRADEGLYAAKAAGRNCLMVCPTLPVNA